MTQPQASESGKRQSKPLAWLNTLSLVLLVTGLLLGGLGILLGGLETFIFPDFMQHW